jgi:hypothetical protein
VCDGTGGNTGRVNAHPPREHLVTSTHLTQSSSTRTSLGRAVVIGAGAGTLASLAMAMYAMLAAWEKDTGFFTPLFHIASLFISDQSMMASMQGAAMGGSAFHFELGPALLGAMIHMMTGAMYGAMFAVLVARLALGRGLLLAAGLVYGAMVFAVSSWIGLPIAAAVFGSGDQITHMAELAGWGTFVVEHLVFGLVLAALVTRPSARTRG